MEVLTVLTSIVNYVALAITIWLAWYILTRSINQPISWLTSLTLFSISGIYINSLLAINPPPIPETVPGWVAFLFPFWDKDVLTHSANEWISGWLVIPAAGFWHHVTMLARPERWKKWHHFQVVVVYLVTLAAIFATRSTPYMFTEVSGDPLLIESLRPGILYTTFLILLTLILLMSLLNLRRAIQQAKTFLAKRQLEALAWATLAATMTAPISYIAVRIEFSLPMVIISLLLAISVFIIGFSVGKYSALIEGRILRRDFFYSGAAMGIVALLYSVVVWISMLIFDVPPASYIFIIIFAFATHSVVDIARRYLDRLFYRKEDRVLRQNIRQISARVGDQGLKETLEVALDLASTSVRATFSLLFLFEEEKNKLVADFRWNREISKISRHVLISDDYQQFDPGHLPSPLQDVVLLIPIYRVDEQIGAILFGPPVNGIQFPVIDIERLMDVGEQIGSTVQQARQSNQMLEQATKSIQIPTISSPEENGLLYVKNIEDALRNIHDYAFLGDSDLAGTNLVSTRLPEEGCTHLDRGKMVYQVLEEAVEKLRPDKEYSGSTPPREWYPYLILYYAYFEDKLNRDIMSLLYISEGTFNRTRRSAIRSVTRVLVELENGLD